MARFKYKYFLYFLNCMLRLKIWLFCLLFCKGVLCLCWMVGQFEKFLWRTDLLVCDFEVAHFEASKALSSRPILHRFTSLVFNFHKRTAWWIYLHFLLRRKIRAGFFWWRKLEFQGVARTISLFYLATVADGFVWSIKSSVVFETIANVLHRWYIAAPLFFNF